MMGALARGFVRDSSGMRERMDSLIAFTTATVRGREVSGKGMRSIDKSRAGWAKSCVMSLSPRLSVGEGVRVLLGVDVRLEEALGKAEVDGSLLSREEALADRVPKVVVVRVPVAAAESVGLRL